MSINHFGRLIAPKDGRDHNFLMRAAMPQIIAAAGKPKPRKRPYNDGPVLDQGPHPYCVGFSARGFLEGAPIMLKAGAGPSGVEIYAGAQERDEWPGTDYEGSSVRGGMKYLSDVGHICSYVWGQTLEEAIAWMNGGFGTVVVGTNWYAEMSSVDAQGFMREPASSLVTPIGGHAWRWIWYDSKKNAILLRNSWGPQYGTQGYAYLRLPLAQRLLAEDGEISAPIQVKVKATLP